MAFDVDAALKEGYTPSEVANYLGETRSFDIAGAKKEGYSSEEILSYLKSTPPKTTVAG
jgi:hypothetical protein